MRLRSVPSFLLAQQPRTGHELFSAKRLQNWYEYTDPRQWIMQIHEDSLQCSYLAIGRCQQKLRSHANLLDLCTFPNVIRDCITFEHPMHKIMGTRIHWYHLWMPFLRLSFHPSLRFRCRLKHRLLHTLPGTWEGRHLNW